MRRSKIGRKSKRAKEMQFLVERYQATHRHEDGGPIEPHKIAPWAIKRGLWREPPPPPEEVLRKQIASYLKNDYVLDPQSREVKKNHAMPTEVKTSDGVRRYWIYYDIFHAPPRHMLGSLQLRRRGMVDDARQMYIDWASYNDNNVFGAKLAEPDLNLSKDVEDSLRPTEWPEGPEGGDPAGV